MKPNRIIALIVGICRISGALSIFQIAEKNYTFPRVIVNEIFEDAVDQHLIFPKGFSRLEQLDEDKTSCQLTLAATHPPNHSLTCDFEVSTPADLVRNCTDGHIKVAMIARDKALLITRRGCDYDWYVLHFGNCTAVPVAEIEDCAVGLIVQSANGSLYDVMENDYGRVMMRRFPRSDEVEEWWHPFPLFSGENALLYSEDKGRLSVVLIEESRQQERVLKILAIDDNGSTRTLKEYTYPASHQVHSSTLFKLLTACVATDSTTRTCVQYDPAGNMKFEMQLPYEHATKGIYNEHGGGFKLVSEKCSEKSEDGQCQSVKGHPVIRKIDGTGKIVGLVNIQSFDCQHPFVHFYGDITGRLCFRQKCSKDFYHNEHMSASLTCYTDKDYANGDSS